FGEIFKIETSGTEYCGDFDVVKFNANSNVDLWVQLVSESELTVSLTSNFAPGTTFPMFGQTYLTGPSSGGFVGGVLFVDGSYATIQGTARFDRRTGAVTNLTGTFIQNGVLELQCFSSGRFSGKRVM
ncbi:MAG TPA: hypothetical protein VHM64_13475, partial [Candidatus Binatia bacterium]|nr:hypothetical protein [Candidatus Binatia bacterium]